VSVGSPLTAFLEPSSAGLRAPAFAAHIDPPVPVARAILSHAHADHAVAGHGEIWATPETAALYRRRHPEWSGVAREIAAEEVLEADGVRLTLHSAGHVLGSVQLRFERGEDSLLYTGDFKRRAGRTAPAASAPRAGTLLMETTFGLPVFRFPDTARLEGALLETCREALAAGETPVLLAYSLGKAQEAAAILESAGIPAVLHGAAAKLLPEYRAAGVPLANARAYEEGPPAPGEALIVPPSCVRQPMVRRIRARRVAYLSGWARREASRSEFDADALIPFSDHADFDGLLAHVDEVAPRRVVTMHGFAQDFARILAARGIEAEPLAERTERREEDAGA
jgi:Cft2 family RNA processing exonuclease